MSLLEINPPGNFCSVIPLNHTFLKALNNAGEKDALLNTPQSAERLQKLLPNVTINIFKDHGHATVNMAAHAVSFLQDTVLAQEHVF